MFVKDGSMYDRYMIKEEGQWYGKDISWQKSRAFQRSLDDVDKEWTKCWIV
jgi:hypothetical protein